MIIERINIFYIIFDQIKTFRNPNTGKYERLALFSYFSIPAAVALLLLLLLNLDLDTSSINILTTSLSIFAALLFNLLLLVYEIVTGKTRRNTEIEFKILTEEEKKEMTVDEIKAIKDEQKFLKIRKIYLSHIFSTISFSILVSVLAVVILLLRHFIDHPDTLKSILDFIVYYLTTIFILSLFIILKNIHILLRKEFQT